MQCDDDYSMRQQTPSRLFSPHPILSIPQSICNQCHKCNNRILKSKPPPIDPPPRIGRNERYKITFSQEHATKSGCSQSKILSARVYLREGRKTFLGGLRGGREDAKKASKFHEKTSEDPTTFALAFSLERVSGVLFSISDEAGAIHILRGTSRGRTVIKRPTEGKE